MCIGIGETENTCATKAQNVFFNQCGRLFDVFWEGWTTGCERGLLFSPAENVVFKKHKFLLQPLRLPKIEYCWTDTCSSPKKCMKNMWFPERNEPFVRNEQGNMGTASVSLQTMCSLFVMQFFLSTKYVSVQTHMLFPLVHVCSQNTSAARKQTVLTPMIQIEFRLILTIDGSNKN